MALRPGESIALPPRLYHKFWGAPGKAPFSSARNRANDDQRDNRFIEPLGRFPEIDEDAVPVHLLVTGYAKYYPHA